MSVPLSYTVSVSFHEEESTVLSKSSEIAAVAVVVIESPHPSHLPPSLTIPTTPADQSFPKHAPPTSAQMLAERAPVPASSPALVYFPPPRSVSHQLFHAFTFQLDRTKRVRARKRKRENEARKDMYAFIAFCCLLCGLSVFCGLCLCSMGGSMIPASGCAWIGSGKADERW